jgi:hypothetical protein
MTWVRISRCDEFPEASRIKLYIRTMLSKWREKYDSVCTAAYDDMRKSRERRSDAGPPRLAKEGCIKHKLWIHMRRWCCCQSCHYKIRIHRSGHNKSGKIQLVRTNRIWFVWKLSDLFIAVQFMFRFPMLNNIMKWKINESFRFVFNSHRICCLLPWLQYVNNCILNNI